MKQEEWEKPSEEGVTITVIVPSYNQGRFLRKALQSIVDQDWKQTQILVVDGGSDDESVDVIREFERWISWWVSEPDRGQSDAINKGFDRASGDLIGFIGADDILYPGAFEDAARLFSSNPACGAVVGAFVRIDETEREISPVVPAFAPERQPCDLMLEPPGRWRLHQVSTFFSAAALDTVGRHVAEDLPYTMDRELLNRICRKFRVVTSEKVYAGFRHHEDSKSVAHIILFSRELGSLHLRCIPDGEDPSLMKIRRAADRRQRARGYMKLARAHGRGLKAMMALGRVPMTSPTMIRSKGYLRLWTEVLRLDEKLARVIGRSLRRKAFGGGKTGEPFPGNESERSRDER